MQTSDPPRTPHVWRKRVVWVVGLVLLTIATRIPLLRLQRPIDDEVVYAVAGQAIIDGGVPYISAVERKPPLLFYTYAGVLEMFGRDNWRALHAVEVGWILLTMAGLYAIGRRLFDPATGLIAALLYSVFQAWSYWNNLAFNGEVLMNLPIVWAYALAFSRPRAEAGRDLGFLFAAGALVAIGFLLKQPAAIAVVPLALYVLFPGRRATGDHPLRDSLGQLVSIAAGVLTVLGSACIWLVHRGLLMEAFYWTITNHSVPDVYWVKGIENTFAFVAFCLPLTGGAWISCRSRELWRDHRAERATLIALGVVSLIGAASSGRFYPHYYIAVVPAGAALAAPWLARVWRASRAGDWRLRMLTQGWLAATVIVFAVAHTRGLSKQPPISEAGAYLRTHSLADDRIFVWGQTTRIYVDAHRRPASRYIATFPLTGLIFAAPPPSPGHPVDTRSRIVPGAWDKLGQDFAAHEPEYIVDTESSRDARYPVSEFPALQSLLSRDYRRVAATADGIVYKRVTTNGNQLAARLRP